MAGKTSGTKKKTNTAKKKTNKKELNKLSLIVTILIILLGAGLFMYLYHDSLKSKIDDFTPNAFTYPTTYEEYVVKYSKKYDVDPVLVFSVIYVESGFDEKAESDVGARGLMQLMPDAFDWVKFRLNDTRDIDFDSMYDPETNIQYGSYYLSYLMDKYDDSIELSAAAYHCGMGLVDGWLEDGTISAENFDVNDIPDENDQTSHYINKITKAYKGYKEILNNQK